MLNFKLFKTKEDAKEAILKKGLSRLVHTIAFVEGKKSGYVARFVVDNLEDKAELLYLGFAAIYVPKVEEKVKTKSHDRGTFTSIGNYLL